MRQRGLSTLSTLPTTRSSDGDSARPLAAFESAMVKVCENPERYRVELAPGIRRYRVPGFPYNILYRQSGTDIEVLVVAPHRRRPGYWLGRL